MRFSWVAVALLFLGWWRVEGDLRATNLATQNEVAFRRYIETQFLVIDAITTTPWKPPTWCSWYLNAATLPEDILETYAIAEANGLRSDVFYIEAAIARLGLAIRYPNMEWKLGAEANLSKVTAASQSSPYFLLTKKAIHDERLTDAEQDSLLSFCSSFPADWYIAILAKKFDKSNRMDQIWLEARTSEAARGWTTTAVLIPALGLLGLASLPWVWRRLIQPPPTLSPSTLRLFRVWRPANVLGVFGVTAWATYALSLGFEGFIYPTFLAISQVFSTASDPRSNAAWFILAWSMGVMSLGVVIPMRIFGVRMDRLRKAWGAANEDLQPWLVSMTLIGLGLLPPIFEGLNYMLHLAGVPMNLLDGLSRSFVEYGSTSLLLSVLFGAILAPFIEEVVFRGLIFRALQRRWGTTLGMWGSSLIFAIAHFYSASGTLQILLYGIIFAWVYHRTGNLVAAIALHAGNNFAGALYAHLAGA